MTDFHQLPNHSSNSLDLDVPWTNFEYMEQLSLKTDLNKDRPRSTVSSDNVLKSVVVSGKEERDRVWSKTEESIDSYIRRFNI